MSISFRSCQLSTVSAVHGALRQAGTEGTAVAPADVSHLDIAENELASLAELAPFSQLMSLDVAHNNVEELSGLSPTLLHLNASYNRLESMSSVSSLGKLVELNVSYNLLTSLQPIEPLSNLQVLLLGGNRISSLIGLSSLSRLELLDVRFNYIEKTSEVRPLLCRAAPALSSNRPAYCPTSSEPPAHARVFRGRARRSLAGETPLNVRLPACPLSPRQPDRQATNLPRGHWIHSTRASDARHTKDASLVDTATGDA